MSDRAELRERIAKALVTGAIGGWTEAQWDRITADTRTRELYLKAADDVLAVLPELTVRTVSMEDAEALPPIGVSTLLTRNPDGGISWSIPGTSLGGKLW